MFKSNNYLNKHLVRTSWVYIANNKIMDEWSLGIRNVLYTNSCKGLDKNKMLLKYKMHLSEFTTFFNCLINIHFKFDVL